MGEADMKPLGKIFTLFRSSTLQVDLNLSPTWRSTCARAPSTNCLSVRFSARTKAWKAARSKSTSLSHMMFLSRSEIKLR